MTLMTTNEQIAASDREFDSIRDTPLVVRENPPVRFRRSRGKADIETAFKGLRVKVTLVRDTDYSAARHFKIGSAHDIFQLMQPTLEADPQENMYAVLVDARHQVVGIYHVARGTGTSVEVSPADVFRAALVAAAAAVILVHNHPSSDVEPSQHDIRLTERVVAAGRLLGVKVLDHIVIGGDQYQSLLEHGLGGLE